MEASEWGTSRPRRIDWRPTRGHQQRVPEGPSDLPYNSPAQSDRVGTLAPPHKSRSGSLALISKASEWGTGNGLEAGAPLWPSADGDTGPDGWPQNSSPSNFKPAAEIPPSKLKFTYGGSADPASGACCALAGDTAWVTLRSRTFGRTRWSRTWLSRLGVATGDEGLTALSRLLLSSLDRTTPTRHRNGHLP